MNYYKIMQLLDMIDLGIVLPEQYMHWADTIILKSENPEYFLLELCITNKRENAISILQNVLQQQNPVKDDALEYYGWERENYCIAFLYLKIVYQDLTMRDFLLEAADYSDGIDCQWDTEKFYKLLEIKDLNFQENIFMEDWSLYVQQGKKIYLGFGFTSKKL